jgi:hypothetical protein
MLGGRTGAWLRVHVGGRAHVSANTHLQCRMPVARYRKHVLHHFRGSPVSWSMDGSASWADGSVFRTAIPGSMVEHRSICGVAYAGTAK